jgi:hypothetical protein
MVGENGARVESFWTDIDDQGQKHTDTIYWMVRKVSEGWRIAGMATFVSKDESVVLNFEAPEDMLARQRQIEQGISRRNEPKAPEVSGEKTADTRQTPEAAPRKSR